MDSHEARMRVMAGLKWFGEEKHYKPMWPEMQFQKMFGVRPNGEMQAVAAAPTRGVIIWIERRNAQFGREQRAKGIKWVPRRNGGK